jgi:Tfp pilus assembly protein PilF
VADSAATARLRGLLGGPRDGALLRMSLANALLADGDADAALAQVRGALQFDAHYSAAWKLLGRLLTERGDSTAAAEAYRAGIAAADMRGDKQALKEMQVFLRRLEKNAGA